MPPTSTGVARTDPGRGWLDWWESPVYHEPADGKWAPGRIAISRNRGEDWDDDAVYIQISPMIGPDLIERYFSPLDAAAITHVIC